MKQRRHTATSEWGKQEGKEGKGIIKLKGFRWFRKSVNLLFSVLMGKEKERNSRKEEDDEKRRHRHKKKKKRDSPELLQDEAKRKKHRADETGTDKRDKSKTGSHHKSHKTHSRTKEKKSGEKHGSRSHKHGKHSKAEIQEISSSDYFLKNNEFATWLKEEKKLFFSDLSSDSARDLFSEFVAEWNDCKLESRYYEGITSGPRTSHNWNIRV